LIQPTKTLPPNYTHRGTVNIHNRSDVLQMLVWSVILFILPIPLIYLATRNDGGSPIMFSVSSLTELLIALGGIAAVTIGMIVIHEGLHGLVFWIVTHERPKFAFKWYYASACAEGWYLPRGPFLIATLLPLAAITTAGLLLLPALHQPVRFFVTLLILFNASGCAGDVIVALRLARLPKGTLSLDKGDEVNFYSPKSEG